MMAGHSIPHPSLQRTNGRLATNTLLLLADAIKPGGAPDEQAVAGQGGRGQAHVVLGQLVRAHQLKPVAGPDHEGHAVFVQAEDAAVAGPRRRREMQSAGSFWRS